LNAVARETLACAAVIGRYFSLPVLRAVTARPINELMESLDQGLAVGMIRRAGDSLSRFVFSRDCVRVAVYELLEPAQRRHWHLRLAEALDQASELGHASASERAEHALAALPEGDPCKAGRYCIEAAHAALSVHAYSEVARFLENARQALAWVEGGDARACAGRLSGQAAARVAASCASGDQRCAPSNPCPACRVTNMATAPLKLVSWVPNE
jgi:predicted ATPase